LQEVKEISKNKIMKKIIICIVVVFAFTIGSSFTEKDAVNETIELVFVDHLTAGLIEQDVYIERIPGTGKVYRVQPSEREKYLNSRVYSIKKGQHHDPFDKKQIGPYSKRRYLGMNLEKWLSAKGTATYSCNEGWSTFKADFVNLAPLAKYTMWHFFMPAPPTEPFTGTLDIPMGDRTGEQAVFETDIHGNASLEVSFESCLQLGGDQLMSGMAIALHSDDKTHGSDPGVFGKNSHVQLFAMLPKQNEVKKYQ